jgi:hypothetical protein
MSAKQTNTSADTAIAAPAGNWVTEPCSPYQLAAILSGIVGKLVRPQSLYPRTNGDNPSLATHLNETGKKTVSPEDANQFISDYLKRIEDRKAKAAAKAAAAAAATEPATV